MPRPALAGAYLEGVRWPGARLANATLSLLGDSAESEEFGLEDGLADTATWGDMLKRQKLPPSVVNKDIWKRRFKEINAFERHIAWNGTLILKFHLRISKEEQRKRFLARLEEPVKRWKFSMGDATDRQRWDDCRTIRQA